MTRHRSHSPRRLLAWWIALGAALVVLAQAPSLRAQTTGCVALDQNEMPRKCTFLEEHGMCLWNALDSYDQCVREADGFWEQARCEIGVQVDLFACNISLPWTLVKTIMR